MALESAVNFKAAIATAAADITTAWGDTVLTEIAKPIRHNHHPLRKLNKLFILNPATGVVTANDAYIDAAYAGNFPNVPNGLDKVTKVAMALTTATVEDAAQSNIVLTFAEPISKVFEISVGGDAAPAKTIAGIVIAGAVVTVTVNTDYDNGDVITLSGRFQGLKLNSIILDDQSVTNNVA